MSDKLTAEEIAKQIREEVATGKYGFVKAVSRALEKHARQEVDEATKPLVEALEYYAKFFKGKHGYYRRDDMEKNRAFFEAQLPEVAEQALTAHHAKYPKHCPDSHNKEVSMEREQIMQFFSYSHLPQELQNISKPFCDLAELVHSTLQRNPERSTALRKLLEAKDAAVRAFIFKG